MPTRPPTRRVVVSRPKPTAPMPEVPGRVEDQHRPGGAEGDVEDEDRQHERADRGVAPHPAEPLARCPGGRGCSLLRSRPCAGSTIAGDEHDAQRAPGPPGSRTAAPSPAANSAAPIGGPASWLTVMKPVMQPGVAEREVLRGRRASAAACSVVLSANTSAVPSRNIATSTTAMETVPVTTAQREQRRAPRPGSRSTVDDDQPAVEPVGERAGVQAEEQRRQPLQQRRQRDQERRRGSGTRPAAVRPRSRSRRRGSRPRTRRAASGSRRRGARGRRLRRGGSQAGNASGPPTAARHVVIAALRARGSAGTAPAAHGERQRHRRRRPAPSGTTPSRARSTPRSRAPPRWTAPRRCRPRARRRRRRRGRGPGRWSRRCWSSRRSSCAAFVVDRHPHGVPHLRGAPDGVAVGLDVPRVADVDELGAAAVEAGRDDARRAGSRTSARSRTRPRGSGKVPRSASSTLSSGTIADLRAVEPLDPPGLERAGLGCSRSARSPPR